MVQPSQASQVALQFEGEAGASGAGAGARTGAGASSAGAGAGGAPGGESSAAASNSALSKIGQPPKPGARPGIQKPILPYSCMFFVMPSNPYAPRARVSK